MSVKDNGLGIDLDVYGNKMFLLYKTFHKNKDSRGVGLFITKNQIESLGGKIEVKSKVNVGTEFLVSFKQPKKYKTYYSLSKWKAFIIGFMISKVDLKSNLNIDSPYF